MSFIMWMTLFVSLISFSLSTVGSDSSQTAIQDFLDIHNTIAPIMYNKFVKAAWWFQTNITTSNQQRFQNIKSINDKFKGDAARSAATYREDSMTPIQKRRFKFIEYEAGVGAESNEAKLKRLNGINANLSARYSSAKVCENKTSCRRLNPDLKKIFKSSRDYDRLLYLWTGWREATGNQLKDQYVQKVKMTNDAIRNLGYPDLGAWEQALYDSPQFKEEMEAIMQDLLPLYRQLHAYVRHRLKIIYPADKFPTSGHIPAHILGDIFAQIWTSLEPEMKPFENKTAMDVSEEMLRQNYTALKIYQTADDFYTSLGLIPMPDLFWQNSILERPLDGRRFMCGASAFDFFDGRDFRIKACTSITQTDLQTAYHEMGHIQYYLQYKDQPISLRSGANPAFQEAVGNVMAMSAFTPSHMHMRGLFDTNENDPEVDLNFLMRQALFDIAFLPFGYIVDRWRWGVYEGDTQPEDYNKHWWDLRCKYQGISAPVERPATGFDAGAISHVIEDYPYIQYFIAFTIQYQFYEAACRAAGHEGPLYKCDFYNSTNAGDLFSSMLKLGRSVPWQDAMEKMTGQRSITIKPLVEYYKPLYDYLVKENGDDYGWDSACPEMKTSVESKRNNMSKWLTIL